MTNLSTRGSRRAGWPCPDCRRVRRAAPRRVASAATVIAVVALACASAAPALAGASAPGRRPAASAVAWRRAAEITVPVNAAPNPRAHMFAVACGSARSCAGGGDYTERSGDSVAMISSSFMAKWARADAVRLPSNAAVNPAAEVTSLACVAVGSCVAVGDYEYGGAGKEQPFIATESKGKWARAGTLRLPVSAATAKNAALYSVNCTAAGSCTAGGFYVDKAGRDQLMMASETKGRWGRAREIMTPPNAGPDPLAAVLGLACAGAGYCSAVGIYADTAGHDQALPVTEAKGRWGRAAEIRMPAGSAADPDAELDAVACTGRVSCVAVGSYYVTSDLGLVMAVTESKGRWHRAVQVALPSSAGTVPGFSGQLFGVACTTAGSCAAVGGYTDKSGHSQTMAVTMSKSGWARAAPVAAPSNAGTGASQESFLDSVACVHRGACVAVGIYADRAGHVEPMAATKP